MYRDPLETMTIGVEEEYLLVNTKTMDLADDPPDTLLSECEARMPNQVTPELMRSQIEVGTKVCHSMQDVREQLGNLRQVIRDVSNSHGLAPIAAATHPFARWADQKAYLSGAVCDAIERASRDWPTACHLRDACSRWCGRP